VLSLRLTVTEKFKGRRLIAVSASSRTGTRRKVIVVGSAHITLTARRSHTVHISLNRAGGSLLARRHRLATTLQVVQALSGGHLATKSRQIVTFKTPPRKPHAH
jgi:hypothetical protein